MGGVLALSGSGLGIFDLGIGSVTSWKDLPWTLNWAFQNASGRSNYEAS
jgi:hypothetical protein